MDSSMRASPIKFKLKCAHERCLQSGRNLRRCSGCDVVRYCCRDCQEKDWPRHKHDCRLLKKCSAQDRGDFNGLSRCLRKMVESNFDALRSQLETTSKSCLQKEALRRMGWPGGRTASRLMHYPLDNRRRGCSQTQQGVWPWSPTPRARW